MKKAFFILSIFFSTSIIAQPDKTGSLAGTITDTKTGESLIGVTVLLEGTTLGAVTDLDGFYLIKDIEPKSYSIQINYVGYKPTIKYNVVIRSGGSPDLNVSLEES
ncbi:MAG: hypothetical protein ACI8WP_000161, partial [Flavobacteriaceae bacterium]